MAKKKIKTVVAFILDKSGSMESCRKAAISGFNEYLQSTKKHNEPGTCRFNLTLFDTEVERVVKDMDVHKVKPLTDKTYDPDGSTALYDAVVDTIEAVEKEVDSETSVLVAIMTDGEENSSRRHDERCLQDLIARLKKEGNWTFAFLGANQDSYAKAGVLGISQGNTINWTADDGGTENVFASFAAQTADYSRAVASAGGAGGHSTSNLFAKDVTLDDKGGEKNDTA